MNPEPCRISDDPSYDFSDYEEHTGYYSETHEPDPDEQLDEQRLTRGSLHDLI